MEIAVVGLGYVGLPLAVAFSKKYNVIGFDINQSKIESYKNGIDLTNEVGNELKKSKIQFTSDETELKMQILLLSLFLHQLIILRNLIFPTRKC